MKIRTFALMLMAMITLNAWAFTEKDFAGTWQSKDVVAPEQPGMEGLRMSNNVLLSLEKDNTAEAVLTLMFNMELDRDHTVDFYVHMTGTGTYALDGDSLRVTLDPASMVVTAPEDEINIRGEMDMFQANQMKQSLSANLVAPMTEQMRESQEDMSLAFYIAEFTDKKFTGIDNENEKYVFSRKKDKKKKK